jgi:TolA-binding protein
MRRRGCPPPVELARAWPAGGGAALEAHVAGCAACRAAWDGLGRAVGLARELPAPVPSAAHRDGVKAALLAAAESGQARAVRGPAWRPWALAAAAAAALALAWLGRGRVPGEAPRGHAVWRATPGADLAVTAAPPDQILRLRDGTVDVEVEPLGAGERFRVVVGDGEVEVRGTAFAVSAAGDRLLKVSVARGRVQVRRGGAPPAMVGPGEAWRAEDGRGDTAAAPAAVAVAVASAAAAPPADAAVAGAAAASAGRAAAPSRRARARLRLAAAPPPAPQESLYDDAWDEMRAGRFREAAAAFARVVDVSPAGPLADEGAFWRAVALARAGNVAQAMARFEEMLRAYPASPRQGEASAMLGWLLVDAHQLDEAEQRFAAAVRDGNPVVRASARQGLGAIDRGRARP